MATPEELEQVEKEVVTKPIDPPGEEKEKEEEGEGNIEDEQIAKIVIQDDKEKEDEKSKEIDTTLAVESISLEEDIPSRDLFYSAIIADGDIKKHFEESQRSLYLNYGRQPFRLDDADSYWNKSYIKEKYNDDHDKFMNDYDKVLDAKNVIDGNIVAEAEINNEVLSQTFSRSDAFAGKGDLIYGEERGGVDVQKAASTAYLNPETNEVEFLTENVKDGLDDNFKIKQEFFSADPFSRQNLYIEPYESGDEMLGYEVVSKWNLDDESTFNMAKSDLPLAEFWKVAPKSLINTVGTIAGGMTDMLQSTVFNDPNSDTYKDLQDFKNNLSYYRVGSTTKARNEGIFENAETFIGSLTDTAAQLGVAMGAAYLTRGLGPIASNFTSRAIYTAMVLDGTRKEALESGMDHETADLYTVASMLGFYGISKLNNWATTSSLVRETNKSIKDVIKKNVVNHASLLSKEPLKKSGMSSVISSGLELGKKLASSVNKIKNKNIIVEGFVSEGLEEGSEEIIQEAARQFSNFYASRKHGDYISFDKNKGRFATFGDDKFITDVMKNVGTSALLGAIAGGAIGGVKTIMGHKLSDVENVESYADIVRTGSEEPFISILNDQYEKGTLGSKTLSFKLGDNGNYEVAKNEEDSQAMFNYQLMLNNLSTVKESLGEMGRIIKDPDFDESDVLLSERSKSLTKDLVDIYAEHSLTDASYKDMAKVGLETYNEANKTEISKELFDEITNIRKGLLDIKEGREHVHAFIKYKIKDDEFFGSEENRKEGLKNAGEYFYEDVLIALNAKKDNLVGDIEKNIGRASLNDADIDALLESHGDRPVLALESFKKDGMLLLSTESINKIIEHNNKVLDSKIPAFSERLASEEVSNMDFYARFLKQLNLATGPGTDNSAFAKAMFNVLKKQNVEGAKSASTIAKVIHNKMTEANMSKSAINFIMDEASKIKKAALKKGDKGVEVMNLAESMQVIAEDENASENVFNTLASFEFSDQSKMDDYGVEADYPLDHPYIIGKTQSSPEEVAGMIDPAIAKFNGDILSLKNADGLNTALSQNIGYLNKTISLNGSNVEMSSSDFSTDVSDIIKEFEGSKVGNAFHYDKFDDVDRAIDSIGATNRFFRLSESNLEFLGKLQRQINANSTSGIVSYNKYKEGSKPSLGVINTLFSGALYDAERIEFLRARGETDNDEYRRAQVLTHELSYDEEKSNKAIGLIDNRLFYINSKIDEKIAELKATGEVKEEDLRKVAIKLLPEHVNPTIRYVDQATGEVVTTTRLKLMEDTIDEINANASLSEVDKSNLIKEESASKINEKLSVLDEINADSEYTLTDKHIISINILSMLRTYMTNQKANLSTVNFSKEIKDSLATNFKSMSKIIKGLTNLKCNK